MVDVLSVPNIAEVAQWELGIPELQNGWRPTGGPPNPAADQGLLNWPLQKMANRTLFLKERVDQLSQRVSQEVTVGPGGQFATLNGALEFLSNLRVAYVSGGVTTTVRLLAGYVMREQVLVNAINLGWIEIISNDAEVLIDRAYLATAFRGSYPAFGATNGGVLPRISVLFSMMATGTAAGRIGVLVWGGGFAHVSPGCGIKAAGDTGLMAVHSGEIFAQDAVFTGAVINGAHFAGGVSGTLHGAKLGGAGERGLFAVHGAVVNAVQINTAACVLGGVRAGRGASVTMIGAVAQTGAAPASTDISVYEGGMVYGSGSTGGTSITVNTITASGIIFR